MKLELKAIRRTPHGVEERHYSFDTDSLTVGRDSHDLRLSGEISSLHLVLYQGLRGELRVRDLGSAEGTFLSDRRIEDAPIGQGHLIRAGEYALAIVTYAPDRRPIIDFSPTERRVITPSTSFINRKAPERTVPGPQGLVLKSR